MPHCMPVLDSPRSAWMVGEAIDTMVWSMKVIATAKIMAVRIRPLDWPPAPPVLPTLMVLSPFAALRHPGPPPAGLPPAADKSPPPGNRQRRQLGTAAPAGGPGRRPARGGRHYCAAAR